jgi:hypothetical protein
MLLSGFKVKTNGGLHLGSRTLEISQTAKVEVDRGAFNVFL